jgi:hypothetical protein
LEDDATAEAKTTGHDAVSSSCSPSCSSGLFFFSFGFIRVFLKLLIFYVIEVKAFSFSSLILMFVLFFYFDFLVLEVYYC